MNFLQLFYDVLGIFILWAIIQIIKHFKPKPIITYASDSLANGFPELKRAHKWDAGIDLVATELVEITGDSSIGTKYRYATQAFDIPKGYVALAFPRSSIANTNLILSNSVGVADAGYIGKIYLTFTKIRESGDIYNVGDRIGQLILVPIALPKAKRVLFNQLKTWSQRGANGYGSTGK
jgi:dUTP pyrophosphatase